MGPLGAKIEPLGPTSFAEAREIFKEQAAALGISMAEFIRRAIRETLPTRGEGAWMQFAGLVESGNPSSSQSIDEIVYGAKD